jgi:broad specificity phosphatase PhoE
MMKMVLMRHGESVANLLQVFSNTGWKHGLTEAGREQARRNAQSLKALYPEIRALYSSPLRRAAETADIIGTAFGMNYRVESRIVEFSVGIQEGSARKEDWDRFYRLWDGWLLEGRTRECIEGGECAEAVISRVGSFFDDAAMLFPRPEDTVLCIGHGGTWKAAVPFLVDNLAPAAVHPYWIDHTERVELNWEPGRKGRCLRFGEWTPEESR